MQFYPDNTPRIQRGALKYAGKGKPVFPCRPDKAPYYEKNVLEHGYLDATTDLRKITAWWNKWPEANIGIPTGKASGLLIVDMDTYKPGAMTESEFEEKYGTISHTATVRTGRGGRQYYFLYPDGEKIPNSAGELGPHVDVRGEGGYTLAPPSVTTRRYEWINRAPLAPVPPRLLQALRDKPRDAPSGAGRGGAGSEAGATKMNLDDIGPIPNGTRNATLASFGGRFRAEGRSREEIEAALLAINSSRCVPPLSVEEVTRIAASVSRYAPGNLKPAPDTETLAIVADIERGLWSRPWPGMGGKTERDIMVCLINLANRYGQLVGDGVEVSIGVRALALMAAVSTRSCLRALKRLYGKGELRRGADGAGGKAGTLVLLARARCHHSTTERVVRDEQGSNGDTLRAPRLRWSSPGHKPKRGLVRGTRRVREAPKPEKRDRVNRLGKTAGAVVDTLDKYGPNLGLAEIAEILGLKRPRDLRRRVLPRLEACGVVIVTGELISITSDWLESLNRERELSGELAQFEKQMRDNNREGDKYRNRNKVKPDPAPSQEDMQERRESYPRRRREAITFALARLFAEHPEYRARRAGQVACMLPWHLPADFPRGPDGPPKDVEVEDILDGEAVA